MKKAVSTREKLIQKNLVVVLCGLFVALSVALGWVGKMYFTFGSSIRITFENIPILLAGILFGPVWGGMVGVASDFCSCLLSSMGVNPIVMLGTCSIGVIAGILGRLIRSPERFTRLIWITMPAHAVGSVIIKTLGLFYWYHMTPTVWELLAIRAAIYAGIGLAETFVLWRLMKREEIRSWANNLCGGWI